MKVLSWLDKNFEKYTISFLFMIFSGLMILNVIMRFIFSNSIAWVSEAVLTIFVWFVWLGISYAFKERAHIKVTAIVSLLPQKFQKVLQIFIYILIIIFLFVVFKSSIDLMQHFSVRGKTSLLLKYPMWLFYLSATVGVSASILRVFQNIYNDAKNDPPPDC